MDLQPSLDGELVTLRPTVPEDWEGMYAAASDPLIWEIHPAHDRWQEEVFRRYFADALASGGGITVRDKASGEIIGASRYWGFKPDLDEIEIGWSFLKRDHWGGAYNREVKGMMIDHAFGSVGTVVFIVGEDNLRSRRAMEKLGGELIDGRAEDRMMAGKPVRHIVYVIRRQTGSEA